MWDKFVKQWLELAFWWVPKDSSVPAENDETVAPSKAEQAVASAPKLAPERVADDLTVIKGIGPAVQKKLQGLDILTFGDLAAADPDALAEKLKGSQPISVAQVRRWTESARIDPKT
jgi:large subunit ribosomal protein L21